MNLDFQCFRHILFAACAAAVIACSVSSASALELQDLVVDNRGGRLMVRFGVAATDLNRVARTVESGERAELLVVGTLYGTGELGNEKPMMYGSFQSGLAWDPDGLQYVLSVPGRAVPIRSRRLEETLSAGWSDGFVDMGVFSELVPGEEYVLHLDFRLERPDVPQWQKDLLFFMSWDADSPESCELNVAY